MTATQTVSKGAIWTGRVMSALPVLMLLFASVTKLLRLPMVVEASARIGISERLIVPIGLIELICCVVYVIPRTSVLGAILMTGLLGGAIITTLRAGDPTYAFPVVLGMLAWGGLWMRDLRVRALIPFLALKQDS